MPHLCNQAAHCNAVRHAGCMPWPSPYGLQYSARYALSTLTAKGCTASLPLPRAPAPCPPSQQGAPWSPPPPSTPWASARSPWGLPHRAPLLGWPTSHPCVCGSGRGRTYSTYVRCRTSTMHPTRMHNGSVEQHDSLGHSVRVVNVCYVHVRLALDRPLALVLQLMTSSSASPTDQSSTTHRLVPLQPRMARTTCCHKPSYR